MSAASSNSLEQLRRFTTIVADTGDIASIETYRPTDATTNPSLILSAAQNPKYQHLVEDAIAYAHKMAKTSAEKRARMMEKLFVNFGLEILKLVPGRVSTEVDARLSYDVEGSIAKAKTFIDLYQQGGIPQERVLIKLASTWEGAKACEKLEKEGIHCNLTLMFSLPQAIACAEAGATLVSPFVGRIHDWHLKANKLDKIDPKEDPGVHSVTEIYDYYKKFGYKTQVMGASFRNMGEIIELAGCDLLTISPKLLDELSKSTVEIPRKLSVEAAKAKDLQKQAIDEKTFRIQLTMNPMASDLLTDGIRRFALDAQKLEDSLCSKL